MLKKGTEGNGYVTLRSLLVISTAVGIFCVALVSGHAASAGHSGTVTDVTKLEAAYLKTATDIATINAVQLSMGQAIERIEKRLETQHP